MVFWGEVILCRVTGGIVMEWWCRVVEGMV